jgi:hypothetical protein
VESGGALRPVGLVEGNQSQDGFRRLIHIGRGECEATRRVSVLMSAE